MKVSLDCIIFGLQRVGGISTYWLELARWLAARDDVQLELELPRRIQSAHGEAIAALRAGTRAGALPDSLSRYLRSHPAPRSGIAHSSYYRLPRRRRGLVRVVTVYDFTYEHHRTGLPRRLHSAQKARAVREADGVICISAATRAELLAAYPNVDPARVAAIPLAVSRTAFFPGGGAAETDDAPLLFVGARWGYKRFDLAVEAAALAGRRLHLIGGGPPDASERAMLDARLPGRWTAPGILDAEGLRRAYASAFALIYPSGHEGFGLPMIEAMACGCPVVAADRPVAREVGGGAALYAVNQTGEAFAATLARLAASRPARVESGLRRADSFSWDRCFDQTFGFYRSLMEGGTSACHPSTSL